PAGPPAAPPAGDRYGRSARGGTRRPFGSRYCRPGIGPPVAEPPFIGPPFAGPALMGPPLPGVPFGGKPSAGFPGGGKRPGGGRMRDRPGWGGASPGRRSSRLYSSSSAPSGLFGSTPSSAR
ncbi:MAG TPA: hypothetical protein VG164_03100, partial [Trebonia sp.]|nr:hypothetical protein [Trebonia sp.]